MEPYTKVLFRTKKGYPNNKPKNPFLVLFRTIFINSVYTPLKNDLSNLWILSIKIYIDLFFLCDLCLYTMFLHCTFLYHMT